MDMKPEQGIVSVGNHDLEEVTCGNDKTNSFSCFVLDEETNHSLDQGKLLRVAYSDGISQLFNMADTNQAELVELIDSDKINYFEDGDTVYVDVQELFEDHCWDKFLGLAY